MTPSGGASGRRPSDSGGRPPKRDGRDGRPAVSHDAGASPEALAIRAAHPRLTSGATAGPG